MEIEAKYVVSLAILMHGKVIHLDITNNIFDDVRLISKAGSFQDSSTTLMRERQILPKLYALLRNDLQNSSSYYKIIDYIDSVKSEYQDFIEDSIVLDKHKVYRTFDNITIDKSLSKKLIRPPGMLNEFLCFIDSILEFQGIFLVSIHENEKLIYPDENELGTNIDLLDINNLHKLADFFGTLVPNLDELTSEFPNYLPFHQEEMNIPEEKEEKKEQIRNTYYELLNEWKLTKKGNNIESIRLSTFVSLIKSIIGVKCFINLFDYSCNSISKYIPKEQRGNMQYFEPTDIETGTSRTSYGGKTNKKSRKRGRRVKRNKSKKYM
jgi:hypothetical protein